MGFFFGSALVVEGEEAAEEFFARGGADGVADAVVFGERLDLVVVVAEGDLAGPAVGGEHGFVQFAVQGAELQDARVAGLGFGGLLAHAGDFVGGEFAVVEKVINVGQA